MIYFVRPRTAEKGKAAGARAERRTAATGERIAREMTQFVGGSHAGTARFRPKSAR